MREELAELDAPAPAPRGCLPIFGSSGRKRKNNEGSFWDRLLRRKRKEPPVVLVEKGKDLMLKPEPAVVVAVVPSPVLAPVPPKPTAPVVVVEKVKEEPKKKLEVVVESSTITDSIDDSVFGKTSSEQKPPKLGVDRQLTFLEYMDGADEYKPEDEDEEAKDKVIEEEEEEEQVKAPPIVYTMPKKTPKVAEEILRMLETGVVRLAINMEQTEISQKAMDVALSLVTVRITCLQKKVVLGRLYHLYTYSSKTS